MRTWLPSRRTPPSTTPSTASSPSDLRKFLLRFPEAHRRSEGSDAEGRNLPEIVDQFLGQAIREIVLRAVAGEIVEGQYRDGMDTLGRGRTGSQTLQHTCDDRRQHHAGSDDPEHHPPGSAGPVCGGRLLWRRVLFGWRLRKMFSRGQSGDRKLHTRFDGRVNRRRLEMKAGNVGAARQLDPHRRILIPGFSAVILGQLAAYLTGANTHDGVVASVIADGAAKELCPDHAFAKALRFAVQSMRNDQSEEVLGAPAAGQGPAVQNPFKVLTHHGNLWRTQNLRFMRRGWSDIRHRR